MSKSNGTKRLRAEDGKVDMDARPGWTTGHERVPSVGEQVLCAGGPGEVVALLGKTGDGSRLLEIRLGDAQAKPFFAAASNVLVAPAA
ncbi:MAG: hypothetical protein ICV87_07210 [Gemmatimonadetes bacterium]|nr:hypothetical protein [Gemmatimonadota bacterium]